MVKSSELGEIFVDGGIVNLSKTSISDLNTILNKLEEKENEIYEKLETTVVEMQKQ